MAEDGACALAMEGLVTGYGNRQVLNGVTIDVGFRETVALIGHNGAGKSTILRAVFGMIPIWSGHIALAGERINGATPRSLRRAGVAYLPQGNRVFADLTVRENLELAGAVLGKDDHLREAIESSLNLFPSLKSRLGQRAGTLSGGERQMLALASALILSPRLLLLDEPSLGLAPPLVTDALERIHRLSRDSGTAVLIVEQKVREVLRIARRVFVVKRGIVSFSALTDNLVDEETLRDVYL